MAFDWGSLFKSALPSIIEAGAGLWNASQQGDIASGLTSAATAGNTAVDPFGSANRALWQGKMNALQADPSSIENLPSYQFALQQGTKGVNRAAAASGHIGSGNRMYDIADYTTGLASQTYDAEMARMMQASGANFAPSASAYADLTQSGAAGQQTAGTNTTGAITDLISSDLGQAGIDYLGDKASEWIGATTQPVGDPGVDSGYGDAPGPTANPSQGAGDPLTTDAPGSTMNLDVGGTGPAGSQSFGVPGNSNIIPGGDYDVLNTGSGFDAGVDSLYGDMPGPALSSPGTMDTLSGQYQGYKDMASQGTALSSLGGIGGGMLGGYLGGKLDTKTPIGSMVGTIGGTFGGATLASMAGGTALGSIGGGVGGAAASGALGAGMAAAGPAAIALMAAYVAQGAYGMYKGGQRKEENRDAYRETAGKILAGEQVADPTGLGLGEGVMHSTDGFDFFLPGQHYTSLNQKNATGEWEGVFGSQAVQGNYGYHQDAEGVWKEGQFGGDRYGDQSFDAGNWEFLDEGYIAGQQEKATGRLDQYLTDHGRADEASTWDPSNKPLTPGQRWNAQYGVGSHEWTAGGVDRAAQDPGGRMIDDGSEGGGGQVWQPSSAKQVAKGEQAH